MTAVLTEADSALLSSGMPGWHIVADLTPPELLNARAVATLRRRIVLALVLVIVLCCAGYANAFIQHGSASDSATAASAGTADLNRAAAKYAGITGIESTVDALQAQVASAMKTDVDTTQVLAKIRSALPASMSIQNLSLTLTPATAAGATTATGLDASGHAEIGTVSVTGSGRTLNDLPGYIDKLVAITGIVNVLPSSNLISSGKAQFSLTFSLTDQLYSHRYDVTKTGVK